MIIDGLFVLNKEKNRLIGSMGSIGQASFRTIDHLNRLLNYKVAIGWRIFFLIVII